jgi:hypothetical protein
MKPKTKLSPRERRHAKMVATLTRWHKKLDQANKAIAKAVVIIPKLERQLRRYDEALANAPLPEPKLSVATPPIADRGAAAPPPLPSATTTLTDDDAGIPDFLRRVPNAADEAARVEITADQAERKAAKKRASAERRKANVSGERPRMPLLGKEALAAIDAGD